MKSTRSLAPIFALALAGLSACSNEAAPPTPVSQSAPAAALPPAQQYAAAHAALGSLTKIDPADPAAAAQLQPHAQTIEAVIAATRVEGPAFAIDYSAGADVPLDHLSQSRGLARVLIADAKAKLSAGDADSACQRAAAVLRLAVQLTSTGQSAVELLTAVALANLAADFVAQNPALGKAPWKTDIQNAIVEVRKHGTLNSARIVRADLELIARSLRENKTRALGSKWSNASQADREAAAAALVSLAADVEPAWNSLSDPKSKLQALSDRAASSAAGDLFPPLPNLRRAVDELNTALDKANAALRN